MLQMPRKMGSRLSWVYGGAVQGFSLKRTPGDVCSQGRFTRSEMHKRLEIQVVYAFLNE